MPIGILECVLNGLGGGGVGGLAGQVGVLGDGDFGLVFVQEGEFFGGEGPGWGLGFGFDGVDFAGGVDGDGAPVGVEGGG